jgi:hypothetical protein
MIPLLRIKKIFLSSLLALLIGAGSSANAKTFTITDTNDSLNATSLRGAVIAAGHTAGKNVILLGQKTKAGKSQPHPWIYHLTLAGGSTTDPQSGDLDVIAGNLTIIGVTSNVVISAAGLGDRVLQVYPYASLTLSNLTLTGGVAPVNTNFDNKANGGCIYNSGILKLIKCNLTGNASGNGGFTLDAWRAANPAGVGGGIFNEGSVQLFSCLISNNATGNGVGPDQNGFGSAAGNGGGIYNTGSMTLTNCRVSGNVCGQGGLGGVYIGTITPVDSPGVPGASGGSGGGILNAGTLILNACTVDNNVAGSGGKGGGSGGKGGNGGGGGDGGGIYNTEYLSLTNCTVSGNFAGEGGDGGHGWYAPGGIGGDGGNGGAIFNSGQLSLTASTIAVNSAGMGGNGYANEFPATNGVAGFGGGILNEAGATNAFARNSLMALNTLADTNGLGYDVFGDFTSQGFNLVGIADDSTGFTNHVSADQTGTFSTPLNPLLDNLGMNGGFTPTHKLLAGSPAIDQGNSFGLHTDQRGHKRPQNNPAIVNATGGDGSDIGAYEVDVP